MLTWGDFPSASVVIGQPDFDRGDAPATPVPIDRLRFPIGNTGVTSDGRLFVASSQGISAFDDYDAVKGPSARFSMPANFRSVGVHGGKLVSITDSRVEVYNQPPIDDRPT
ncbi:hypothetical protein [Ramlibacter henchirensis]|uniref:hypothetical protein n=1 Tax=Ramlibacter henchirensis TaxID=204072 RepID=UPI001431651B|nr:hypothetical protein [Ramlibacter henchirensis]